DDIDNALPVCFECHSEIHCYNTDHPRGRKFTEKELRLHKEQWLNICKKNPEIFSQPFQSSDAGPLNSLIDELEYNMHACNCLGSSLSTSQFDEALRKGSISLLEPEMKKKINSAYSEINRLNQLFYALNNESTKDRLQGYKRVQIDKNKANTKQAIINAHSSLLSFLQKDTEASE
ncbi:MAG: hypothetical protein KAS23_04725, partial [Anaerohalosphaera sp.]|nr:hypothetical protein [Anaerohalosphaera sp.]